MDDKVDVESLHYFYRGLSEIVGVEAMLKIYNHYKGTQISVPLHLYDRNLSKEKIRVQYDGTNARELSHKYGYSQRWIREVGRNKL
ncbi:hypothetical protein OXT66_00880 [Lentilactobacillus senioris]|uniref:Mor transcription activator family protein n=1 Tax=Lentilactobacillus senioris TaxID=931534 RepID=UPI00227F2494|nr:Mor transcription activator family protein [Lentilactobacillus senioris]MCY9806099.1 hypothetical protein [Lentilactobacillus senioris]